MKIDDVKMVDLSNGDKIIRCGNNKAVVISYDSLCESPREWDNLGKMLLDGHRYYSLPIEITHKEKDRAENDRSSIVLEVYMYDHGGVILSTNDFGDRWDSGLVGWIVATAEDIRKKFGVKRITKKIREKAIRILDSEVITYSKYLNGEVYRADIYEVADEVADEDVEKNGEVVDCCGGYYSVEDAIANVPSLV